MPRDFAVKACYGNFLKAVDLMTHDPFAADETCRSYCTDTPCLGLFGNRTQECGACGPAAKCHPRAPDWNKLEAGPTDVGACMAHCERLKCDEFDGNPAYECAGCPAPDEASVERCYPGADHFDDYLERMRVQSNAREL